MKLFALSLLACAFASCASPRGFQRTAMDLDMNRYGAHQRASYDACLARESVKLICQDSGKTCWRLGAGPTRPISFEDWKRNKREGVFYSGAGYVCGDHAVEFGCYYDRGHLVHFGCGPATTQLWKSGGERGDVRYWGKNVAMNP